ncbi:MAG: Enzyme that catalyzes the fourth step in the histidine pathway [Chrysothrix sp. TS-e1954]|nr:MAG: Enzyme that catalyzes the fourth step in the histidine pathway [Chrysothrix sp. TS-e1954]
MTRFRPCIDLHAGQVKQIVGGTLTHDNLPNTNDTPLVTNYTSTHPPSHFARLYRDNNLRGSHVIMLGPGNEDAAREALAAWPGQLQVGGGINEGNAAQWLEWGASEVIVTSYLFPSGTFSQTRLASLLRNALNGRKDKLVIDLSCRRKHEDEERWWVAMNKWTTITDFELTRANLQMLQEHCAEFLIHAAGKEGLQAGIDEALVARLAEWCDIPVTYAGGGRSIEDLELVKRLSSGKVDLTIGSALDIFGGSGVKLEEAMQWNREQETAEAM